MKAVVLGAGSWGTVFSRLLADRGVDVTLAAHHAADAQAIDETGRNPRFSAGVDLDGIAVSTIVEAPVAGADLIVVAVPSRVFRQTVEAIEGSAPVLSLTKGLDPGTGERLSTLVQGRSVAGALGAEHGGGGRRRAARRDG